MLASPQEQANTEAPVVHYSTISIINPETTLYQWSQVFWLLFPLDRGGRFGGDVVHHTVDPRGLVDDAVGDPGEHIVGDIRPFRGHEIAGRDRTERDRIVVGARVPHDTDTLQAGQDRKILADRIRESRRLQFPRKDRVCLAQDFEFFFRDVAQDAYRKSGPRKGWRMTGVAGSRVPDRPGAPRL